MRYLLLYIFAAYNLTSAFGCISSILKSYVDLHETSLQAHDKDHHIVVTGGHQYSADCRSEVFDFKNPDNLCEDLPACYGGEGDISGLISGRPISCGGGASCCGTDECLDMLFEEFDYERKIFPKPILKMLEPRTFSASININDS